MDRERSELVRKAVEKYEARLLRYTSRFVYESQAREIVQETFLRLWQEDVKQIENHLVQWLFTVCRNQAFDLRRREAHRSRAVGDVLESAVITPEENVSRGQQTRSLLILLSELTEDEQEVIRLKFQEELSYKEISAITGHSVSYVGVLIHTGMEKMRERIEVEK